MSRNVLVPPARALAALSTALVLAALASPPAHAQNYPPVATAGGPFRGTAGYSIRFDGGGSFDADGDALTYHWNFGDGTEVDGRAPFHTYTHTGVFDVTLTVSDALSTGTDATTATIGDPLAARAFTQDNTKLSNGKQTIAVRIEPVQSSFAVDQVSLGTISMRSSGTGSVDQVSALVTETYVDGDKDRNGVVEIRATFAKRDLRQLFSKITAKTLVPVVVFGQMRDGQWFEGSFYFLVDGVSSTLAAQVTADPARGTAVLELTGESTGPAVVRVFDVSGRVVGTATGSVTGAWRRFDLAEAVRNGAGGRPGVYFYRVETARGSADGRFVYLR